MNDGIRKFRELLLTDEEFQQKLKKAAQSYAGEITEETVFHEVLVPLAAEYGISVTYDEFREYFSNDQEIDNEELSQIAGGKTGGFGGHVCRVIGAGIGTGGGDGTGGFCVFVGGGWGQIECFGEGEAG